MTAHVEGVPVEEAVLTLAGGAGAGLMLPVRGLLASRLQGGRK